MTRGEGASPVLLDIRGLSKTFTIHHLSREVPAFSELSMTVREGQFILITGPNGAGKSTLLRCLYRTCLATSGSAVYRSRYGEIDLANAADVDIIRLRREEIGHVTQFLRPRPRASALELVMEPLREAGAADVESQAERLLRTFGLKEDLWNAYPTTFSGGEQQKVNLARALGHPRRLLLLDEPTASLDSAARSALVTRLAELLALGVAMIGVFHHPEDVRHLVNREFMVAGRQATAVAQQIRLD